LKLQRSRHLSARDDGLATVFTCLAVAGLVTVTVAALWVVGAVRATQKAGTAADLGALAGAAMVLQGADAACARAAQVIAANGAAMSRCEVIGFDVRVQVAVAVALGPVSGQAAGRARAGPDR
jgi:secretion/DNA translocation related TadE-like protein